MVVYSNYRISELLTEDAINSAYEQKVLLVAAKDNKSNNLPDMPSGGEHNKVFAISASGEIILNTFHELEDYCQWGEGIDLLAPSPGWGVDNGCPPNVNDNVVYTTRKRFPDSWYSCPHSGTSFAAPQVAGISALLHAKSLDLGWNLHPEDFEGILKVAANDINHNLNYTDYYDEKSGWGLVNAKNIFKKIVTEQYELKHYTLEYSPSTTSFEPWSDWYLAHFDNSNSEKCIPTDKYQVRRRKVNYTITHSYTWLDRMHGGIDYKIYVWGNGGNKHSCNDKKGFNFTGPNASNFQTGYTGVNSGYGNCFEWNMIHDYASLGNNSHKFEFSNYQYEVQMLKGGAITKVPEDNMLAAHYSVFARRDPNPPSSVRENSNENNIEIYPSIANNQISVRIINPNFEDEIIVLNTFGTPLLVKKVTGTMNTLDVAQFSNGTYFVVNSKDKTNIQKFIILK